MAHVFISYHKKSSLNYARELAEHFIDNGFDVWIDDRIDYGADWWKAIDQAIADCGAFVVIMTPEALNSRWVQRELSLAEERNKPVFPLLYTGDNWSIFVRTQYIDVRDDKLPAEDFLRGIENCGVERKGVRGSVVMQAKAAAASPVSQPISEPVQSVPIRSTMRWLPFGAVLIVAVIAAVLITINAMQTQFQSYPTPTSTITQAAAVPTVGATATQAEITPTHEESTPTPIPNTPTANPTDTQSPTATSTLIPTATPNNTLTGQIVYAANRNGNIDLYVMNVDGTGERRLTEALGADVEPMWSPDGNQIAFSSIRDGDYDIYVMDSSSEIDDPTPITPDSAVPDHFPAWSPNGRQIAYVSQDDSNPDTTANLVNLDNLEPRILFRSTNATPRLVWSTSGDQIAYWDFYYSMFGDLNGNRVAILNLNTYDINRIYGNNCMYPAWSPIGDRIAYVRGLNATADIHMVDSDGYNGSQLGEREGSESYLQWSLDGRYLAFLVNRDGNLSIDIVNVADGSTVTSLTPPGLYDTSFSWR